VREDIDHDLADNSDEGGLRHVSRSPVSDSHARCEIGIAQDDLGVDLEADPAGCSVEVVKEKWSDVLTADPGGLRKGEALGEQAIVQVGVHLEVLRERVGDHEGSGDG
jgi:hypothetical protein